MYYLKFQARPSLVPVRLFVQVVALFCAFSASPAVAQNFEKEISISGKPRVKIVNLTGRVTLAASENQKSSVLLKASSPGKPVAENEVSVTTSATGAIEVAVAARGTTSAALDANAESAPEERIDLNVTVPPRATVEVRTSNGLIEVIGNVEEALAQTSTGTIRADVPSEALNFKFLWTASRPRFFSELELPEVKEKAGGKFEISGRFGEKSAPAEERVRLNFSTERGVMLLGVAPEMVPTDLRERKLTEAIRAVIRSGDPELLGAVRKVSPRLFRDFAGELSAHRGAAPTLGAPASSSSLSLESKSAARRTVRLSANVTDRLGRAISGLTAKDFQVFENGQLKPIAEVEPSSAPFNLVLLLDVSGSVEERLDFIRKAARSFVTTASSQDRLAVISFRDDVQLISDFTTNRPQLLEAVNQIDAGGSTALYDSLAYVLLHTLRPLRGARTAVVVLSDGDDNKSFLPFPSVLDVAIESGAMIYPLYVPSGLIRRGEATLPAPQAATDVDPIRNKLLTLTTRAEGEGRRLAEESGGVFYSIKRLADLQQAYQDIMNQLRTSYGVTYLSDHSDARERRVRVRVDRADAAVKLSPAVEAISIKQ